MSLRLKIWFALLATILPPPLMAKPAKKEVGSPLRAVTTPTTKAYKIVAPLYKAADTIVFSAKRRSGQIMDDVRMGNTARIFIVFRGVTGTVTESWDLRAVSASMCLAVCRQEVTRFTP